MARARLVMPEAETPALELWIAERVGVSKSDSWIDYSTLEECMREDLNEHAPRRIAVLDPVRLVIDNYPQGQVEQCHAPNHPQKPEWGQRAMPFSRCWKPHFSITRRARSLVTRQTLHSVAAPRAKSVSISACAASVA